MCLLYSCILYTMLACVYIYTHNTCVYIYVCVCVHAIKLQGAVNKLESLLNLHLMSTSSSPGQRTNVHTYMALNDIHKHVYIHTYYTGTAATMKVVL